MSDAFDNALYLAQNGFAVFPSGRIWSKNASDLATTDSNLLDCIAQIDPACGWRVCCGREFGALYVLDTPRQRDLDILEKEMGKLPTTLTVGRLSGGVQRWFKIDAEDADVKLGVPLFHTRAALKTSAAVPMSVCEKTFEQYEIINGDGEFNLDQISKLPDQWLVALPKNGGPGITSAPTLRHEFSPRSPSN